MPVHDWTRVDAGVFPDFHNVWIALLRIALNSGVLPDGYYAMSEQHAGRYITDVLTLHQPDPVRSSLPVPGGLALAEAPPRLRHHMSLSQATGTRRKTLTIRHVSGHRIVALVEIASPANKDRKAHVDEFVSKLADAVTHGIHLVVVDLFPPGKHDPHGLHGALLERLGEEPNESPAAEPLTLASNVADSPVDAFWEHIAVGSVLPDMPLFLSPDTYIETPLEETYETAWQSTPAPWREILARRGSGRRKPGR